MAKDGVIPLLGIEKTSAEIAVYLDSVAGSRARDMLLKMRASIVLATGDKVGRAFETFWLFDGAGLAVWHFGSGYDAENPENFIRALALPDMVQKVGTTPENFLEAFHTRLNEIAQNACTEKMEAGGGLSGRMSDSELSAKRFLACEERDTNESLDFNQAMSDARYISNGKSIAYDLRDLTIYSEHSLVEKLCLLGARRHERHWKVCGRCRPILLELLHDPDEMVRRHFWIDTPRTASKFDCKEAIASNCSLSPETILAHIRVCKLCGEKRDAAIAELKKILGEE